MSFDALKTKVADLVTRHKMAAERVDVETKAAEAAEADLAALREATAIAQEITKALQQQAHHAIATTVTRCLGSIFDSPYKFRIDFESKRGRTEARLSFERDGVLIDPMTASGGGVVDVAAFALRLSTLFLQPPPVRKVLILDEPFRFVSAEYIPRVAELLEKLADEMSLQIIMITHIDGLRMGECVELL